MTPKEIRPLQVLLVSHYFPAHRGGVEIVAGELAMRLARQDQINIDWYASNCDAFPESMPSSLVCHPQPAWNGLEASLGLPFPLWSLQSYRALGEAVRKADIVHIHDYIYPSSQCAAWYARRWRKPIVITQHIGLIPYRNPLLRNTLSLINRLVGSRVLAQADQVIFISEAVKSYFSSFSLMPNAPVYWPNGVNSEIFKPLADPQRDFLRASFGLQPERPLFLFVGRFVEKKGLATLHRLAKATPEAEWYFAGHGPYSDLHPGTWELPHVHVFDGLSGASLAPLYQAADLLILPSRGEGFPLVVQESMACGTPVFVSTETAAGCPEAGHLMLSAACDADDSFQTWKKNIDTLISQPHRLKALRASASSYAVESWSWPIITEKYTQLFNNLLSEYPKL